MSADDPAAAPPPASFPAARTALETIEEAVRTAEGTPQATRRSRPGDGAETDTEQALAALLLLRELRHRLAGWETGLIETARAAGASWADLAHPLGVTNRQSAERRYLRLRPGAPNTTGEQRIQATRDRRAADRTVTTWARGNAADLRQLAAEITARTDLPAESRTQLTHALGRDDVAALVDPLLDTRDHLATGHPDLAARVDHLTHHTERLRQDSNTHRNPG